jgi:hypothetical protein
MRRKEKQGLFDTPAYDPSTVGTRRRSEAENVIEKLKLGR